MKEITLPYPLQDIKKTHFVISSLLIETVLVLLPKMHDAYKLYPVVKEGVQVESITAFGESIDSELCTIKKVLN